MEQQAEQPAQTFSVDSLGGLLRGRFETWKQARQQKEMEWLDNLRAFNGQYTAQEWAIINDPSREGLSKIFVGLTRMKVTAAYSRVTELLFQPGQRYWSCDPSPKPNTPKFKGARKQAKLEVMQLIQQGMIDPRALGDKDVNDLILERIEEIELEARNDAAEASKRMGDTIDDQLKESHADRELKRALMEMIIFGDGCIKGATVDVKRDKRWETDGTAWTMKDIEEVVPRVQYRSVFDIYPDPYATSIDDATGLFDRHMMTQTEFKKLGSFKGFDADLINEIISQNRGGNYTEEMHETERRVIAGINTHGTQNRFEVLEYWGVVSGHELASTGIAVDDETAEYQANVWLCAGRVIKAMLNPLEPNRIPYQIVPYERGLHSFWGVGVPAMMKDSQQVINAAARMMIDNSALSAGAQVEINTDLVAPGTNVSKISPFKIWARSGGDASQPLLRFHNIPNNSQAMMTIIDIFRKFADEETSLPSYSHGQVQDGMTKTASGMSMLMGAANISIKNVIKNIDDYLIEPMITSFYDWNMRWNDDETIKGDGVILAQGSTGLMSKEIKSERVLQFTQMMANPAFAPMVDAYELLNQVANAMDLPADKLIYTEKELEAQQQAQQQALAANQQPIMGGGIQGAPVGQPAMAA